MKKLPKLGAAFLALGAALGIIVNGTLAEPKDVIAKIPDSGIVVMAEEPDGGMEDSDEGNEDEEEKNEKGGFFARFRAWFLRLPRWVRIIFGLPLWALGHILTRVFEALIALLSALLAPILKWLFFALILLIVFAVIMKWIFPDMPLSTILCKRNVIGITGSTFLLAILSFVLTKMSENFARFSFLYEFFGGLLILVIFGYLTYLDDRKAYVLSD